MSEYQTSNWVRFLRQYGPIPQNEAMYDEHVHNAARRNGVDQPTFDSGGLVEEIAKDLRGPNPRSIILTGTAGDGKTWTCRAVWTLLGGDPYAWRGEGKDQEHRLTLPSGVSLVVIKDLSELDPTRSPDLPVMAESVAGRRADVVFLVAANDGQLREAWQRITPRTGSVAASGDLIESLLIQSRFRAESERLAMFNLSRQDSAHRMGHVLDVLLSHEGWRKCDGCPGQRPGPERCPIWENKQRLADPLLRERLSSLLTLADQSGAHLPMRQSLLLASNMLLGHPDGQDRLMRCQDAAKVVRDGTAHLASVYRNAFGENLPETRREGITVFDVLRRFGIGEETSNRIDNLIVYGHDDPELRPSFDALLGADAMYGASGAFLDGLRAYLEGGAEDDEDGARARFVELAVAQRQRLFFTVPREREAEVGLWELTVFLHAGTFLERVLRPMREGRFRPESFSLDPLVRGLNRVFTGRLTEDVETLWLTSSGSHSQSRVCRVVEGRIPVADEEHGPRIALVEVERRPELHVRVRGKDERLPLHLIRFEFLQRVAAGALPSNFSRECYEDLLAFKSRLLRRYAERPAGGSARQEHPKIELLSIDGRGELKNHKINMAEERS
jgi:hypothetical protein